MKTHPAPPSMPRRPMPLNDHPQHDLDRTDLEPDAPADTDPLGDEPEASSSKTRSPRRSRTQRIADSLGQCNFDDIADLARTLVASRPAVAGALYQEIALAAAPKAPQTH